MTNWARVIAKGWPGAEFRTDSADDPMLPIRRQADPGISARTIEIDGVAIEWMDAGRPRPTIAQLRAKATEVQPLLDAEDAGRQRVRAFRQKWPHERIVEAIIDDAALRAEFIADARAAR